MKYTEIRDQIKSGDLIALSHYKWASWYDLQVQAVRFGTQSEYSHVAIAWVFAGRVFVIESVVPFIRIVPLSLMDKEGFYWIPMDREMSDTELEFAMSEVGVGEYSKWEAIKAQFKQIKIAKGGLWECAKFVIVARKMSGIDLGDKATPSAVVQAAQKLDKPVYFVGGSEV